MPKLPPPEDLAPDADLRTLWASGRPTATASAPEDPAAVRARLATLARQPQRVSIGEQVATIAILSVLVAVLVLFFRYLSPLESDASNLGKGLMIGGVVVRILIEGVGLYYARRISLFDTAAEFVRRSWRFLRHRRRQVRPPAVALTLGIYTVGYYLLFPEYALYFSTPIMWLLALSYPVIMSGVVWFFMRPGLRRERAALAELEAVVAEVSGGG